MATDSTTAPGVPPAAVMRMLAQHSRDQLEGFIEIAIGLLDLSDGDSDLEDNHDREAFQGDDQLDQAWVEWHTMRGSQKGGPNILAGREDDEEDDPSGECSEDGINTAFDAIRYQSGSSGAGCILSDPDYGVEDQAHDGNEGI